MKAVRKTVVLLAIAVTLCAVPALALAHANHAGAVKVTNCGDVSANVAVTTQGGVSCKAAKKIAKTWLAQKKQTTGFKCHKKKTGAGSGFQGVCKKGTKVVTIIPE
jgi:hypothetical protein